MPTQRTHRIEMTGTDQDLIRMAAWGMYTCNHSLEHAAQIDAYGGFADALNRIMMRLCYYDPDFMELWDSNRIQGSLNIGSWQNYAEQIKTVLASEGIEVILK